MPKQVIESARKGLRRGSRELAIDARRDMGNARASLRVFALSVVIAALMGAAGWAFLAALRLATGAREAHLWLFLLLPAVNMATAWLYRNHGLRAQRGNNLVIDSTITGTPIHKRMALLTFACSTATHLAGGSAGREGAAVQMGGTIASNVASLFHVEGHDRRDLMMAGISAAFGAAFGTPLAGAFFGMEMCFIGKIDYTAGIYCLVASFTGYFTSLALGTEYEANVITSVPAMSPKTVVIVVISAIIFGLTARLFAWSVRTVKSLYGRFITNYLVRALIGALVVLAAYALLDAWNYAGLATWLSGAGFSGNTTLADASIKLVVTALTLGAGFQGGEVTPLFGIGAALGGWIGCLTGLDPSFLAALGMLGVFCAGLNVPITTCMMDIDLFHGTAAGFFVIVAFISYLTGGHRGVYPAQRIISPKRRSLIVDEGGTVAEAIERHNDLIE